MKPEPSAWAMARARDLHEGDGRGGRTDGSLSLDWMCSIADVARALDAAHEKGRRAGLAEAAPVAPTAVEWRHRDGDP
jgi:hypothetical protein